MNAKIKVALLPLFNTVFFPSTYLPLHIKEPMQIELLKYAIKMNHPVAVCLGDPVYSDDGQPLTQLIRPRTISGIGIPNIVQEYPDGSIQILMVGQGKIKLQKIIQNSPYLICEGQLVYDRETEEAMDYQDHLLGLRRKLEIWIDQHVPEIVHKETLFEKISSINHIVDYLSLFVIKDKEIKQIILETDSLFERVQMLNILIQEKVPGQEMRHIGQILKNYETIEKQSLFAH